MLLGNKCDMTDRRVVSKERGEKIAIDHQIRFLETSAKANINIDKAFYDLAEAILDKVGRTAPLECQECLLLDAEPVHHRPVANPPRGAGELTEGRLLLSARRRRLCAAHRIVCV